MPIATSSLPLHFYELEENFHDTVLSNEFIYSLNDLEISPQTLQYLFHTVTHLGAELQQLRKEMNELKKHNQYLQQLVKYTQKFLEIHYNLNTEEIELEAEIAHSDTEVESYPN